MLKDAGRAQFDVVMSWAMDRLGRSLADLIDTLRTLESANVDLFLHHQAIDTKTPAGRMFFHVTGAFAEFERDMIRSRVNVGLAGASWARPGVTGGITYCGVPAWPAIAGSLRWRRAAAQSLLRPDDCPVDG